jgi:oxaloacetate decarboxylase gamma subunit
MPMADLLMQGIELMFLGMGIVFCFLVLLVFMMQGMSWLAHRISGEEVYHAEPAPSVAPVPAAEADLIAAIGAAGYRYRARHRK